MAENPWQWLCPVKLYLQKQEAQGPYLGNPCPGPLDWEIDGRDKEAGTSEALALPIGCTEISSQGGGPGAPRGLRLLSPPSPETFAAVPGRAVLTVPHIPGSGLIRSHGNPVTEAAWINFHSHFTDEETKR